MVLKVILQLLFPSQFLFPLRKDKFFLLIICQQANICYLFCLHFSKSKITVPNYYSRVVCSKLDMQSSDFGMTSSFDSAVWNVAVFSDYSVCDIAVLAEFWGTCIKSSEFPNMLLLTYLQTFKQLRVWLRESDPAKKMLFSGVLRYRLQFVWAIFEFYFKYHE